MLPAFPLSVVLVVKLAVHLQHPVWAREALPCPIAGSMRYGFPPKHLPCYGVVPTQSPPPIAGTARRAGMSPAEVSKLHAKVLDAKPVRTPDAGTRVLTRQRWLGRSPVEKLWGAEVPPRTLLESMTNTGCRRKAVCGALVDPRGATAGTYRGLLRRCYFAAA